MSAEAPIHAGLDQLIDSCSGQRSATAIDSSLAQRYCSRCGRIRLGDDPCGQCEMAATSQDAAQRRAAKPCLGMALAMYFAMLVVLLAYYFFASDALGELVGTAVMSAIVFGFSLSMRDTLLPALSSPAWRWCGVALILAPLTFLVADAAVTTLLVLLNLPEEPLYAYYTEAGYGFAVVLLAFCVQPAVVEEVACRGVIFSALRRSLAPRETIIVSAFMFTMLHMAPLCFPHLFVLGLILGYLRHRSGSLLPCIVLHFTHNFLVLLASA